MTASRSGSTSPQSTPSSPSASPNLRPAPNLSASPANARISAHAAALPCGVANPEYLIWPRGAASRVASDTVPAAADVRQESPSSTDSAPFTSESERSASNMPVQDRRALVITSTFTVP